MSIRERFARIVSINGLPVAAALVVAVLFFSIASPYFMTGENIRNLLIQSVFIVILAAGLTFVLIAGGIDLSVGSTTGLSAAMTLMTLMNGAPLPLGLLAGVTTGLLVGLINAFFIAILQINAFIVTLATLSIGAGALQVITTTNQLTGVQSDAFAAITKGNFFGVPTGVVVAIIVLAVLEWVLVATSFGRKVFAIGTNSKAAYLAGTNVRGMTFGVYVLSGIVAGIAGVLLASYLNSVQPGLGGGYELTAIAAAVLGGVSLAGGRGSVWRAVIGALFLATLSQGLQIVGVDPMWFNIVTGSSIVIAVAFDRAVQRWVRTQLSAMAARRSHYSGVDPALVHQTKGR